ncbi:MAG TPA: hypothetical protein VK983_01275 [Candidatus Limnocylindrales bacterium]|nr:hypothetical protein [Candidatus Limnocylindrales bacterium]
MSHESPFTPERRDDAIAQSFDNAQQCLYKLTADPSFHATLIDHGVDPYDDMGTPKYWHEAAAYAQAAVARGRERGGDPLRLSAFELAAATPAFVFDESNTADHAASNHTTTKNSVRYNSLLRNFAESFPDAHTSVVSAALVGVANRALEDPALRQAAPGIINNHIRGIQHEVAFGQILDHTGRNFRPADEIEDGYGYDYIIEGERNSELQVDVKASLHAIEKLGAIASAYAVRSDGRIVMHSLTKDEEFKGRFTLPEEVAASKAPVVDELLSHAEANRRIA